MTVNLEDGKNGELLVIVGMYEKDNWQQHVVIRLTNFPEVCESVGGFDFTIDGSGNQV
jgi:hypothetical protein